MEKKPAEYKLKKDLNIVYHIKPASTNWLLAEDSPQNPNTDWSLLWGELYLESPSSACGVEVYEVSNTLWNLAVWC